MRVAPQFLHGSSKFRAPIVLGYRWDVVTVKLGYIADASNYAKWAHLKV